MDFSVISKMNDLTNTIGHIIDKHNWVIGGQNFDEDVHFSSFYIRLSSKKYLGTKAKTGYRTIISTYDNFNETYYIPKSECETVAKYLLKRIKGQPEWMNDIIMKIYRRCTALSRVFDKFKNNSDFSDLSERQIIALYEKHFSAHWKLYEIARIPEALDRGTEIFTDYLKCYLRKKYKKDRTEEINELFYRLTTPEKPSIFQEESFNFSEIVKDIEKNPSQKALFINPNKKLSLNANPIILKRIDGHREKWGYLDYHGYTHRELPNFEHYVERINACLRHGSPWKSKNEYSKLAHEASVEKERIYSKHNVDRKHQEIFALYWKIGLAKLFRRLIQLKNFFFLDKLIYQIALRKGCEENIIRCLLPEEIENLLQQKLSIDKVIAKRLEFIVYIINGKQEKILGGIDNRWVKEKLDQKVKSLGTATNELRGSPAYLGYARGICKVIIRPYDAVTKSFRNGEIIVSESTNPDFTDLIAKSGGVVTQQGGVTCHAAIICRELGKPAIVGVRNLLNTIKDYDEIILDAYSGKLSILRKSLG